MPIPAGTPTKGGIAMAGKSSKPAPKIVVTRNSENGKFVKPSYGKTHPNTTEKETYKRK